MGTTYSIIYVDSLNQNYTTKIDSILARVNHTFSTYLSNSMISKVNEPFPAISVDDLFETVFNEAKIVYEKTNGAFDPTILPLVNFWGFGSERRNDSLDIDSNNVDSLLQLMGFDNFQIINADSGKVVFKKNINSKLDFSAIAKGFGVDEVGKYLESVNIYEYMVEIGGEVRCRGHNANGNAWRIGIDKPKDVNINNREIETVIRLNNLSIATSGNYRNYYRVGDKVYTHIINPRTGYPERSNLLSVSVVAEDCMTADAYATAFMVMGVEDAKNLIDQEKDGLEIMLFYDDKGKMQSWHTDNFPLENSN